MTLKIENFFFPAWHPHMILPQHTKFGNKIFRSSDHLDKQSLTYWTVAVTLTLNAITQIFHRTLQLMMLYYQTKFVCKQTSGLEDIAEIVIFWLYKPLLWPWHWRQWTIFSAWHSGLCCCITIPSLVAKYSAIQKYSSRQMFTNILNLCCDLDLKCSNPVFPHTPACDAVLSNQLWLQIDQQFRRYKRNSHVLIM